MQCITLSAWLVLKICQDNVALSLMQYVCVRVLGGGGGKQH